MTGHDAYKMGAVPIVADARLALVALTEAAEKLPGSPIAPDVSEVRDVKQEWLKRVNEEVYQQKPGEAMMTQGQLVGVMNDAARPGDTIIAAAGSPPAICTAFGMRRTDANAIWSSVIPVWAMSCPRALELGWRRNRAR